MTNPKDFKQINNFSEMILTDYIENFYNQIINNKLVNINILDQEKRNELVYYYIKKNVYIESNEKNTKFFINCRINFKSNMQFMNSVIELYDIKDYKIDDSENNNVYLILYDTVYFDFFGFLYNNIHKDYYDYNLYFTHFLSYLEKPIYTLPKLFVFKTCRDAIIPSKAHFSDVGYDISIIKKVKDFNDNTSLYDTGIKINIEFGYYVEIVPRSSLSKSGYMLSNSIGIIEKTYSGNIFIALTKTDEKAENIKFPFKCCQLIIKKQIFSELIETDNIDNIDQYSNRKVGGFGSTG
jgi:deoxyuridine 5'-triphosphate nucleotidohydrolase